MKMAPSGAAAPNSGPKLNTLGKQNIHHSDLGPERVEDWVETTASRGVCGQETEGAATKLTSKARKAPGMVVPLAKAPRAKDSIQCSCCLNPLESY